MKGTSVHIKNTSIKQPCNHEVRDFGGKRGHIVAETLLLMTFPCACKLGNIADTKSVSATNVARAGKRGNICVGNNVSATICPRLPVRLRHWQTRTHCCGHMDPKSV